MSMSYYQTVLLIVVILYFSSIGDSKICSNIPENRRIDCLPGNEKNATICEQSGCCWIEGEENEENNSTTYESNSFCFYPVDYPDYNLTLLEENKRGFRGILNLKSSFGSEFKSARRDDLKQLKLSVHYDTATRLRFKLFDPEESRWQVPIPLGAADSQPPSNRTYNVTVRSCYPFSIRVYRQSDNETLFETVGPLRYADQFLEITTKLKITKGYGMGERHTEFLRKLNGSKKTVGLWARDSFPAETGFNLYGVHNFFMGLSDTGNAFGIFLLNSNAQEIVLQSFQGLTYRTIGGIFDFFLFTGPTPTLVVQQYMELVGKPILPPFWSLGFHLCKYGVMNLTDLRAINTRNRKANIPFDVQWSDIEYMDEYHVWTYDKVNYEGLPQFAEELHNNSQRLVIIADPGIGDQRPGNYSVYDEGMRLGIFINRSDDGGPLIGKVWPGTVVFPDFSHPFADKWWTKQIINFHKEVPFDGLWIDMNEPANFFNGSDEGCSDDSLDEPPYIPKIAYQSLWVKTVCPSARHYNSTRHYDLHNLYGYHNAKSTFNALSQLNRENRPFILSRSTFPGSGRYTFHWTGDVHASWSSMRKSISQILRFNMFGIVMVGADVCGFLGETSEELCIRWTQLGAFYPFMRNHANKADADQDPASWSEPALNSIRRALKIRYSLLPYLYTLLFRATVDGTTVARSLSFEFPQDTVTHPIDRQFLLGSALLLSPVLIQGAENVTAYFPQGRWFNFHNGKELSGSRKWHTFAAPLDEPVVAHIRGGSVIPKIPTPALTTDELRRLPFSLVAYADDAGRSTGELFWDNGQSTSSINSGNYNLLQFNLDLSRRFLNSYPVRAGYHAEAMMLTSVEIHGVSQLPSIMVLNGILVDFSCSSIHSVRVYNFRVNFLQNNTFQWD